jgi:hypothetical protein
VDHLVRAGGEQCCQNENPSTASSLELVGHKGSDRISDERRKMEDEKRKIRQANEPEIPAK